ncbi:phosphotransferase family protein [Ornithinibacillus sp. 179-J 7C1 HS]|uniref:phosphotransferase family protein n=1 Tax=Ornithinibacillus sp. 179-J 7C1 HS TaxID=3142384 RepID=UPI00399F7D5E
MDQHLKIRITEFIGKIKSIELLAEQGCTSQVQKVISEKNIYILKSSFKEKYREWLRNEAAVLQKLSCQTHILVPKYYGFMEEAASSHLIMSFEPGTTLTTALKGADNLTEKKALVKSFGQMLQTLHEVELIDTFQSPSDWLAGQLEKAREYLEMGEAEGDAELLEKLKVTKPQPVKQTIIHGDCTTDNVLVVDGKVKLFIDVAGMTIGDPRYDEALAIGRFIDDAELINSFYEGYTRYKVSKEEYTYFDEGLYEFF